MKETGIIMTGNHPRLILDGIKTMTRRVIKPQPSPSAKVFVRALTLSKTWQEYDGYYEDAPPRLFDCPYGQVGDRLYLKESHRLTKYDCDGERWLRCEYRFEYENDGCVRHFRWAVIPAKQRRRLSKIRTWDKWRSGRFMYKFLARIWLEITEVRVERVQEIDNHSEDFRKEGYEPFMHTDDKGITRELSSDLIWFSELWDSLNAKRGYGWDVNHWVWVISFKVD